MVVLRSLTAVITLLPLLYNLVNTQDLVSPCPRVFVYEDKGPTKWYGIITLLSDTDLSGFWLRVILDRPALQLGNWLGQATPSEGNKEYSIHYDNIQLKAGTPKPARIFVKYNTSQPPAQLVGIRLNARTLCPEGADLESTSPPSKLHTSDDSGSSTSATSGSGGAENIKGTYNNYYFKGIRPGSVINLGSAFQDSEDFFSTVIHLGRVLMKRKLMKNAGQLHAPVPLITNGQDTSEGEYPWHAALYQTKGVTLDYLCGASLITKSHIITAAHCVTKWKTSIPRNTDTLVTYLGRYNLHRFNKGTQERLVADIIPHHQYNPQRLHNDIAIVKFTMPIKITDHVRPVCLWRDLNDLSAVIDKQGSVVGWGIDQTGKLSEKLKQAKMPVVSQETCLRSVPEFFPLFTSNRTFSAGFRNGTSVCNGDSGDGMVFPTANSNPNKVIWQLRGIVSLSVDLKMTFKCDPSHYVVFTDAAKHLDWIKQVLRQ